MPERIQPPLSVTAWRTPLPPSTRLVLQGNSAARAAAAAVWGVPLSEMACRAEASANRAALWLGPDEHLLLADEAESAAAMFERLAAALGDLPHSLVDVSHRQLAFEIHGTHAEAILAGGCPLDLSSTRFPLDMCTRTVFGKADIVLWRRGEARFHIEVWRSFSDYLGGLMEEIARDYD